MPRLAPPLAVLALILCAAPAHGQGVPDQGAPPPPPAAPEAVTTAPPVPAESPPTSPTVTIQPVGVSSLAAPDAFSTAGRDTGLPTDLWRGTPVAVVKTVLPLIASRPLSPAAAALARRVLATGAPGPKGGDDGDLVGLRASALLALGDIKAAAVILERAPGVDRSSSLSRAAAESALLAGVDARACAVGDALSVGRGDIYWLRLRTYCQALAGQTDAARLTFDLAQAQAKDPVFARLMGAKLAGGASPGAASLRNGLDLALSRSMNLDLTAAKPAPGVAAALTGGLPSEPAWDPAQMGDFAQAATALAGGGAIPDQELERLIAAPAAGDPKLRGHAEAGALLAAATAASLNGDEWTQLAVFVTPPGKAPVGRTLALDAAGDGKRMGEAAMLALWICADAGAEGLVGGDRVRIIRALAASGLTTDARNFALEGLAGLK